MKKLLGNRKLVISLFVVVIVALTLVAIVPLVFSLFVGRGVQTGPVNADRAREASVGVDGTWEVVQGSSRNYSSVGFTFNEVLPGEKTTTSGSTTNVIGQAVISGEVLEQARVSVDMTKLTTDKKVRDQNMKTKLFETGEFPEATFELTEPVDVSGVPVDGTPAEVDVAGDLEIKGVTQPVEGTFTVLRDGADLVVGGDIPINRLDFDVVTPEFIAATIEEEGAINIRLSLRQADGE